MVQMHKHKGLLNSDGKSLRSHPVSRKHSDSAVQKFHNESLGKSTPKTINNKRNLLIPVDKDGYVFLDMETMKGCEDIEGARIKFKRVENGKKRTVGLQIEVD